MNDFKEMYLFLLCQLQYSKGIETEQIDNVLNGIYELLRELSRDEKIKIKNYLGLT